MGRRASTAPKKRDQEVLDAAARVFSERGYADASVQDVADELGILKGSLYHYIATKQDLLFRLLAETHDQVDAILADVREREDLGALARLELYVRRQVDFNTHNLIRVSVYYQDLDRLGADRRKALVARRKVHEGWVEEQIREAQGLGQADPALDVAMVSRCIFATIVWTYRWYREGRHARDEVADVCAAFALNGLGGDRGAAVPAPLLAAVPPPDAAV